LNVYQHGLKFGKKLAENLDDAIELINNDLPAVIIVDGNAGRGKTTLTVEMGDYVNKKFGKPPLDLKSCDQYAMGGKQFLEKLRKCHDKEHRYLVYDEGGDFSRRSSLTKFNGLLNQAFDMSRALKMVIVISLLRFWFVDQHIFDNGLIIGLVHCRNKCKTYSNYSGFSLYEMLLMKHAIKKMPIPSQVYSIFTPNFRGQFLDLEADRSRQLSTISIANKKKIIKESEIKIEGLMSKVDLAKRLNMSVSWVEKKIKDLKLKETKKINRVNYFNAYTLEMLAENLDTKGGKR